MRAGQHEFPEAALLWGSVAGIVANKSDVSLQKNLNQEETDLGGDFADVGISEITQSPATTRARTILQLSDLVNDLQLLGLFLLGRGIFMRLRDLSNPDSSFGGRSRQ